MQTCISYFFIFVPLLMRNIMKKIKILFLFVCLSTFLSACGDDNDTSVPVAVKTVLMYLVGDNNISGQIYNNIESVERGLSEVTSPGTFAISRL